MSYNYDLAGDVQSWAHPGSFTLTNTVSAAQRITAVQSSLTGTNFPQTLAQNITYTPWGALSQFENGCVGSSCTNALETYTYNNRLQASEIQLGTSGNAAVSGAISLNPLGMGIGSGVIGGVQVQASRQPVPTTPQSHGDTTLFNAGYATPEGGAAIDVTRNTVTVTVGPGLGGKAAIYGLITAVGAIPFCGNKQSVRLWNRIWQPATSNFGLTGSRPIQ